MAGFEQFMVELVVKSLVGESQPFKSYSNAFTCFV